MKQFLAVLGVCGALSASALATSIFVQGTITEAKDGGYKVKGYDHYNAKRYENKITEIDVKYAKECAFVLDNRVLDRQLVVVPGRKSYAIGSSAGAMLVVALSEPMDREVGLLVGAGDGKVKLKLTMGADTTEIELPASAAVLQQAAAFNGKTVRLTPARKQTLLAFSPAALVKPNPAMMPVTTGGVLRGAVETPELTIIKDGQAEALQLDVKRPGVLADVRGFPGHGQPDLTGIAAGSPATMIRYFKRPGVPNTWLVVQAADTGRREGVVKAVSGNQVTVSVLTATGAKDETFNVGNDTVIKLDGKDAAVTALKPGLEISVFAARDQQLIAAVADPAESH